MDMSVSLNSPYPAAKPVGQAAVKPAGPPLADAPVKAEAENAPAKDDLVAAVEKIDKYVNASQRNLSFSIDEDSGKVVVKVIATATGEVIRQLPSAEALHLAEKLDADTARLLDARV